MEDGVIRTGIVVRTPDTLPVLNGTVLWINKVLWIDLRLNVAVFLNWSYSFGSIIHRKRRWTQGHILLFYSQKQKCTFSRSAWSDLCSMICPRLLLRLVFLFRWPRGMWETQNLDYPYSMSYYTVPFREEKTHTHTSLLAAAKQSGGEKEPAVGSAAQRRQEAALWSAESREMESGPCREMRCCFLVQHLPERSWKTSSCNEEGDNCSALIFSPLRY